MGQECMHNVQHLDRARRTLQVNRVVMAYPAAETMEHYVRAGQCFSLGFLLSSLGLYGISLHRACAHQSRSKFLRSSQFAPTSRGLASWLVCVCLSRAIAANLLPWGQRRATSFTAGTNAGRLRHSRSGAEFAGQIPQM